MHRVAVLSLLIGVMFAATLAVVPRPVAAATLYGSYTSTPCVNAGSSVAVTPFPNAAPSGKTWSVYIDIGLSGGDTIQNVWTEWHLQDQGYANGAVWWRDAGDHWETTGVYVWASTLTLNMIGNMYFAGAIHNPDTAQQCFIVAAQAYYW